ncbi:MAG: CidA/LrgA family protein [Clostridiales bacterium]|nr:CidA/LrgA family protein [Clostridiales bacterium]
MKLIIQFGILIGFWLVGELLSSILESIIAIPGSILGMVLLFVALTSGVLKEKQIKDIGDFLLTNIAFFFVPASVAILALDGIGSEHVTPLVIVALVSTFVTMVVTMLVTHVLTRGKEVKK